MKTNTLDFDAQALRERILDLAMRGKLVPQDPNDEPASVLLEKIKAEKEELVKEKKIKKSKPLPAITDDEKPFDIPDSWEWIRLNEVGVWAAGATPSRRHPEYYGGNIPWLKTGDLNDGIVNETSEKITELGVKNSSVKVNKPGNVLIAMYGATIGKLGIVGDKELVTNQACCGCSLFDGVYNWYLFYYLLSSRKQLIDLGSGGAQPNISKNKIEKFVFPLPPFSEQSRIAAKIAQLFALLRKVESSTQQYAELQTLLKSKVLDLAVRGKLVKQDLNDEPASVLVEKIKADTATRIANKQTKKIRMEKHSGEENLKYKIPDNWTWTRLGYLIYKLSDGAHRTPKYISEGIPFLSVKDMSKGKIEFENCKYISKEDHARLYERCNPEKGDILLSKVGTTGVPALVETEKKFDLFVSIALLKFNHTYVDQNYLKYLIESPIVQNQAERNTRGVGNKNWVLRDIAGTVVPLPPISEQKRIVSKIKQLSRYCD